MERERDYWKGCIDGVTFRDREEPWCQENSPKSTRMTPSNNGEGVWTGRLLQSDWWLSQLSTESQKPMETVAEIHRQVLDQALQIPLKRGRRDCTSRGGGQGHHKQLSWSHRNVQTLDRQAESLHGTHLGSLLMNDSCAAWAIRGNFSILFLMLWLVLGNLLLILGCFSAQL